MLFGTFFSNFLISSAIIFQKNNTNIPFLSITIVCHLAYTFAKHLVKKSKTAIVNEQIRKARRMAGVNREKCLNLSVDQLGFKC